MCLTRIQTSRPNLQVKYSKNRRILLTVAILLCKSWRRAVQMGHLLDQMEPVKSRYSRSLGVTTRVITATTLSQRLCHSKSTSQTVKQNRIRDHSAPPDSKYRHPSITTCKGIKLLMAETHKIQCTIALTLLNLPRTGAIHHVFHISTEAASISITRVSRLTCQISTLLRFKRMKMVTVEHLIHGETLANNRSVRTILIFWCRILLHQFHRVVDTRTQVATKWLQVIPREASSSPALTRVIKIHKRHLHKQVVSMSGRTQLRRQGNSCSSNFSQMAQHNNKM